MLRLKLWILFAWLGLNTNAQLLELELQNASAYSEAVRLQEQWQNNGKNAIHGLLYGKQLYLLNQYDKAEAFYLQAFNEDLLNRTEVLELVQILIANRKIAQAINLMERLPSKSGLRYRLLQDLIEEAGTNDFGHWKFSNYQLGFSPVRASGALMLCNPRGAMREFKHEQYIETNFLKVRGLKGKYIRHAFLNESNEELWVTHPVDGRFRISVSQHANGREYHKIREFTRSDKQSNYIHAVLNASGEVLIFASDMEGGYGGYDLYMSFREANGWTTPKNMGPAINTSKNEIMPWLSNDNTLFFSSDGHPGLGGYDLYSVDPENPAESLQHLPPPLNSPQHELGASYQSEKLYFIGRKLNGKLEIIRFWKNETETQSNSMLTAKGKVIDQNNIPVKNALVFWEAMDRGRYLRTNENGEFEIPLDKSKAMNVALLVKKEGHKDNEFTIQWSNLVNGIYRIRPIEIELLALNPSVKKPAESSDQSINKNDRQTDEQTQSSAETSTQDAAKVERAYFVIMASSKDEPEMKRRLNQIISQYPNAQLLYAESGYIRLGIPAGITKETAIPMLRSCRKIVSDCWLLKTSSTQ